MDRLKLRLLGLLCMLAGAVPAGAATFTVDTTGDAVDVTPGDGLCATAAGECTLRAAIQEANASPGRDAVQFNASLAGQTITLTNGDLPISADLDIFGPGATSLTISGNNSSGIFRVDNAAALVQLDGLTISGGRSVSGGAILNIGTLTVTNSAIRNNSAESQGGGIWNGGGTLTLTNSLISDNVTDVAAGNDGGGIFNQGGTLNVVDTTVSGNIANGHGGGILNRPNIFGQSGPLTLIRSTISDNVGIDGGGIFNQGSSLLVAHSAVSRNRGRDGGGIFGGGFSSGDIITIISSTVSGNTAATGGGIRGANLTIQNSTIRDNAAGAGGGIFALGTSAVINSTISNNVATGNGVLATGGGVLVGVGGGLTIANSTISANMAGDGGGGICNGCTSGTPGTSLSLTNSIVANNNASQGPDLFNDTFGVISVAEHNLIGTSADSDIPCGSEGNLCDIAALLGPLQANGGATATHALLPGSPAIDAGSLGCPPPAGDQRGFGRPLDGTGDGVAICDIGAFEDNAVPLPLFTLTVNKGGTGRGVVTSAPTAIACGVACVTDSAAFAPDTLVSLTATPAVGSMFEGWGGDPDCGDGTVTMAGDRTCSATFTSDDDGDGVPDRFDFCGNTPGGAIVDANGCSDAQLAQLDNDFDGVPGDMASNGADRCPGTPREEVANDQGCSASQPHVRLTPPTGRFLPNQAFEIGIVGHRIDLGRPTVRLNGLDVSAAFMGCAVPGTATDGNGTTLRCSFPVTLGFLQQFLAGDPGPYTLSVTLNPSGSPTSVGRTPSNMTAEVRWETLAHAQFGGLTISPPSGTYLLTQQFDLGLTMATGGFQIITEGVTATLDGDDVTQPLISCVMRANRVAAIPGGVSAICPGLTGTILTAGTHILIVHVPLSDGALIGDMVTWQVLDNREP
jgi:CSLREA domain-containing protein